MIHRFLFQIVLLLTLAIGGPAAAQFPGMELPGGQGAGERVSARIIAYEGAAVPGREVTIGVLLNIQPGWKIQAGEDSGDYIPPYIPTTVTLSTPEGWQIGGALWPQAKTFTLGEGEYAESLAGYEGRIIVAVPVLVPDDARLGEATIRVVVAYQACDEQTCEYPTSASASVKLSVTDDIDPEVAGLDDEIAGLFTNALARQSASSQVAPGSPATSSLPDFFASKTLHWWIALLFLLAAMGLMLVRTLQISRSLVVRSVVVAVTVSVSFVAIIFVLGMTSPPKFQWVYYDEDTGFVERSIAAQEKIVFAKFTAAWCANCHVNERIIMGTDAAVELLSRPGVVAVKVDLTKGEAPGWSWLRSLGGGGIPFIAVFLPGEESPVLIRGQLTSAQPIIDAIGGKSIASVADDQALFDFLGVQFTVGREAIALIFVLAFIAGFFMNFTPCVLPVIPLKVLSLQAHAKDPKKCFRLGLIFSLGIVAFYAALGVLMAGLITGLERMDWGEFWGNWWLAGLVGLIVGAMGLGMMGLFTIQLPQSLYMFNPTSDTKSGSFFMGVFTAILSTPCTGPLLGATVAWLALQPAGIAFSTLLVMGAGMAFPYVLLTANPAWLQRLPRTGPGSELVKQVMGLLLLAVATFFIGIAVASMATGA